MNDKKWAKHIIRRFGKEGARHYSKQSLSCPCEALNRRCDNCKYAKKKFYYNEGPECKRGIEYYKLWDLSLEFIRRVKKIIRERLE